ncbi:uncharacterized protein LOC142980904 [Anticarsia gemmatalis]|uniref:uncharacterized protein LOC142980904 n=1 Tax=Anticarsia gemmatalis TaxID=129554 RepID=UPI003F75FDD9
MPAIRRLLSDDSHLSSMTFNTLSMISTPWCTDSESDYVSTQSGGHTTATNSLLSLCSTFTSRQTSATVLPKSSSTWGDTSAELCHVPSKTTITVSPTPVNRYVKLEARNSQVSRSQTLRSWSVQTFTSAGMYINPGAVKAKFPWSPASSVTGSDYYPSSLTTLASTSASSQPSRATTVPEIRSSLLTRLGNRLAIENKMNNNFILNYALIEQKIPFFVNMIDTRV